MLKFIFIGKDNITIFLIDCMYLHLQLLQNRTQNVSSKKSLERPLEKSVNKYA